MSKFWRHFISDGHGGLDCGHLGIDGHGVPIPRKWARRFGLLQATGVEVWAVEPDGPADEAGILEDDLLISVADQPVVGVEQLHRVLRRLPVGLPLGIMLLRGGRRIERWVVATDYRDPARRE